MPRLRKLSFQRVAIVSVVNHSLFSLRLAEAHAFHTLSELIASLILTWSNVLDLLLLSERFTGLPLANNCSLGSRFRHLSGTVGLIVSRARIGFFNARLPGSPLESSRFHVLSKLLERLVLSWAYRISLALNRKRIGSRTLLIYDRSWRPMSRLRKLSFRRVVVITIVYRSLFRLRLAESEPLGIVAEFLFNLVLTGTGYVTRIGKRVRPSSSLGDRRRW